MGLWERILAFWAGEQPIHGSDDSTGVDGCPVGAGGSLDMDLRLDRDLGGLRGWGGQAGSLFYRSFG